MRLTDEMIQEDDKRFKRQNLLAEFNYCGKEVPKRNSITNDDIRFYAWLCRSAYALLKEQEALEKRNEPMKPTKNVYGEWLCGKCGNGVVGQDWMTAHGLKHERHAFCRDCGQAVKWE